MRTEIEQFYQRLKIEVAQNPNKNTLEECRTLQFILSQYEHENEFAEDRLASQKLREVTQWIKRLETNEEPSAESDKSSEFELSHQKNTQSDSRSIVSKLRKMKARADLYFDQEKYDLALTNYVNYYGEYIELSDVDHQMLALLKWNIGSCCLKLSARSYSSNKQFSDYMLDKSLHCFQGAKDLYTNKDDIKSCQKQIEEIQAEIRRSTLVTTPKTYLPLEAAEKEKTQPAEQEKHQIPTSSLPPRKRWKEMIK